MEDLLQPQLEQSFRLAMPEGLSDLMCDISREVIREKPQNLYQFITDYLGALLLARDTLCNACKVCGDICHSTCQPELDDELRKLGLDGEDLETAKNVVFKHFDKGEVHEADLITQLVKKTGIDINLLEDIQVAVRAAFIKHERRLHGKNQKSDVPGQTAARKTLDIYERDLAEEEENKTAAAVKIQATFRGYLIKRSLDKNAHQPKTSARDVVMEESTKPSKSVDEMDVPTITVDSGTPTTSANSNKHPRTYYGRLSSTSLAGSFMNLPKYIPYSIHEITYEDYEEREKEHSDQDKKKIVFHEKEILHEIYSSSDEECDDEEIAEDIHTDSTSVESDDHIEDIVHDFTDESEDQQIDNTVYTEEHVADEISNEQNEIKDCNVGAKLVEEKETVYNVSHRHNKKDVGFDNTLPVFYDKTIDDDGVSYDSMQYEEVGKEANKQRYAKADNKMMKNLKDKLMNLSSSEVSSEYMKK